MASNLQHVFGTGKGHPYVARKRALRAFATRYGLKRQDVLCMHFLGLILVKPHAAGLVKVQAAFDSPEAGVCAMMATLQLRKPGG